MRLSRAECNPNLSLKKPMKRWLKSILVVVMATSLSCTLAQVVKETTQELSKKAHKGFMDEVTFENGNINVLYKIKGDKKADEIFYEMYTFDKDLKFIESKPANEPKVESKPDREQKYLNAYVGGKTSFDVLSMKLKVRLTTIAQKWDYRRQRYVRDKVISDEVVKLKEEGGKSYYGVAELEPDPETKGVVVLAYYETDDKKNPKQFMLLTIDYDGNIKEKNIDATGAYSMVYCQNISEEAPGKAVGKNDFIVILAPKKGAPDPSKYVYLHYDLKGNLKNKVEFNSPSPNLLVNSIDVKDGEVFLSALSKKENHSYDEEFAEYATIESPGYMKTSGIANYQKDKYDRNAKDELDNFHLLKFSGNKMVFATTAKVSEFKSKARTVPGEKTGKIYNGKKFKVTNFEVTPANEFLVAGQLTFQVNIGDLKNPRYVPGYGDIICLHFDANGNLKAQYAVDKVYEDKKSEVLVMPQKFYVSGDGKYAYWQIMELKGFLGYNNFWDAYADKKSYRPRFFPRITRIDLQNATLSEFKNPGQGKYFAYEDGLFFNPSALTTTFVGRDYEHEVLWICKVTFE